MGFCETPQAFCSKKVRAFLITAHQKEIMENTPTNNGKVIFLDLYQTLLDVELSVNNPNHEIEGWGVFAKTLLKYGKKISGLEFHKLYAKRRDDFYSNKKSLLFFLISTHDS
ncbi:MAG: hypothetical protein WAP51_01915 [Candidatus Sungiibacteriota bacterium]